MLYLKRSKKSQHGVALFVSLVFLLILTILGISSMQSTVMEEKMARNFNEQNRALQAAEVSLREAEIWMQSRTGKPNAVSAPSNIQVWELMDAGDDPDGVGANCSGNNTMWWRQCNGQWWSIDNDADGDPDNTVQVNVNLADINTNPYYVIEAKSFVPDSLTMGQGRPGGRDFYRMTARGSGGSDLSRVLLQSTYATRF